YQHRVAKCFGVLIDIVAQEGAGGVFANPMVGVGITTIEQGSRRALELQGCTDCYPRLVQVPFATDPIGRGRTTTPPGRASVVCRIKAELNAEAGKESVEPVHQPEHIRMVSQD